MNQVLTPTSPPPSKPKLRRFTREEYYQMVAQDFFLDQRVELIWGRIVQMPPMLNRHAAGTTLTEDALRGAFGPGYWIRVQMPLNLSEESSPEPDLSVVAGGPRDFSDHPTSSLLVVEVSDSTLRFDRQKKAVLYASANLQDYWIVNLIDRQLEVYRDPRPDLASPQSSRYGQVTTLSEKATVTPLAAPNSSILIADMLP